MGGDWSGFGSNLVGVLVVVRIFSGGGWLVGSVVGGDNFFFLGNFSGDKIDVCG